MNKQQFIDNIQLALDGEPIYSDGLSDIIERYPYCQSGQMLYFISLLQESDIRHHSRLKLVSAYAGDRSILRYFAEQQNYNEPEIPNVVIETPEVSTQDSNSGQAVEPDDIGREHVGEGGKVIELEEYALNEVKSNELADAGSKDEEDKLTDNISESAEIVPEKSEADNQIADAEKNMNADQLSGFSKSKAELIDRFIKNSPRISRSKSDFYNPVDYAHKSEIDKDDIVSETLAKIHLTQGSYEKAIKI